MEIKNQTKQYDYEEVSFTDEELRSFQDARIGTYFILPLRTLTKPISKFSLDNCIRSLLEHKWQPYNWEYDDLYSHTNRMFNIDVDNHSVKGKYKKRLPIGINFQMSVADAFDSFSGEHLHFDTDTEFYVCNVNNSADDQTPEDVNNSDAAVLKTDRFCFKCFQIVITHSGIGFLVFAIQASNPEIYDRLLCSGYNDNKTMIGVINHPECRINICDLIGRLLSDVDMTDYSMCLAQCRYGQLFRDTTIYTTAILPEYIHGANAKELANKLFVLCLNLRQAESLGAPTYKNIDPSLSFYTHASVSHFDNKQVIRWGLYTLFEHTTEIIFDPVPKDETSAQDYCPIEAINLNSNNREDNYLPFLLIALYERYSYLFFTELLSEVTDGINSDSQWLEEQMLHLRAFGIIMPHDMSPYSNVNVFLSRQREIYDIPATLDLIENKINIVKHAKDEIQEERNNRLERFLTIFGIVSILCDSIGLVGLLMPDVQHHLLFSILFAVECLALGIFLGIFRFTKKKSQK